MRCFAESFDAVESSVPLPGELGHCVGRLIKAIGVYPVEDLSTLLSAADQPAPFEHDQVF
jgi:hypothetical protein